MNDSHAAVKHAPNHLNTPIFLFFAGTPILAAGLLTWYVATHGFVWTDLVSFFFMYFATGLSITAGYHRCFTHRTYDSSRLAQFLFLFFGAASVENSCLNWSTDHRYHHFYSDRDGDPYSVRRGFWWAHLGWIFFEYPADRAYRNVTDLTSNRLVMWQHRFYVPLVVVAGFLFPMAIGALFGRPGAGLIWGGLVRMVVVHHATFLINSAAHTFGKPRYDEKASAADSPLLAAFTFGEGYHSFHHAYAGDYRIGHHWYDVDPGKWLILAMKRVGLATKLRTTYKPRTKAQSFGTLVPS